MALFRARVDGGRGKYLLISLKAFGFSSVVFGFGSS